MCVGTSDLMQLFLFTAASPPKASFSNAMAPMKAAMKGMKARVAMKGSKSITKGGLAEALATATELKKSDCSKVLTSLGEIVAKDWAGPWCC